MNFLNRKRKPIVLIGLPIIVFRSGEKRRLKEGLTSMRKEYHVIFYPIENPKDLKPVVEIIKE